MIFYNQKRTVICSNVCLKEVTALDYTGLQGNKQDLFKEFSFHIENARFAILSDRSTELEGKIPVEKKKYDQLHFHSYYELFYVNNGKFIIKFEDGIREFAKDDLIIISPGTNHKTIVINPGTARYNFNFLMEKNSLKTNFSLYDALKEAFAGEYTCINNCYSMRDILKKMVVDIMHGDEVMLGMHFHALSVGILEILCSPKVQPVPNQPISDSNMIRMYKLQQIIFTTYSQDISLNYIADKLFLSTRQASRIIQQYFGCTYRELVAKMRMKVAVELLENTDMTILEIASQVGYNSIKGFYKYFKKQYNCLPTEYRKKLHGNLKED